MVSRPQLSPETDLDTSMTTTWLVFTNETDLKRLKILKKGFRHCFAIMQQSDRWILIDPRSNKTDIRLLAHPIHFNLPRYFKSQGHHIVKLQTIKTPQKVAPILNISCVGLMKRFIGLHAWFIITPYQLYRHLNRLNNKKG